MESGGTIAMVDHQQLLWGLGGGKGLIREAVEVNSTVLESSGNM